MNQKYTVIVTGITGQPVAQIFCCDQADNEAHAREQAENAYPGCRINTVFKPKDSGWLQIYSPNEAATSDGAGFWSNEDGWVEEGAETLFDVPECMEYQLPLSLGRDAEWRFVHACAASQVAVARHIRSGYLAGNRQDSDEYATTEAMMESCPSMFATRDHAWSFLMEDAHENLELEDGDQERHLRVGDEVRWTDPDNNEASGCYTVKAIKSTTVVELSNGDCSFEAFVHELS
ncbi:hypothetical protein NRY68_05960 [Acidithiobacillus ferrooxidans]|uniref:hypothetical protein n=1 Tax=Acidithiobacillus ferrooxidans TaxID=920 RepID=UPI002147481E|nr:hypothetical protein [Acidithiobacillus ferrooxidans]MCR1345352.1 hypothetical protein [Acidithiobacillus ferrooxidans]MCR1354512.1 hypothetical protein [Acidithiobacillus ferrooxidans]